MIGVFSGGRFPRWAPWAALGLLLLSGSFSALRWIRKPRISQIDRPAAAAGDQIVLTGRFFGDGREGSKLFIGDQAIMSEGILEWAPKRITARVPRKNGTDLVRIKTRLGFSNALVLGDAARFPRVEYGPWLPGAPFIEYIDPPAGGPGTLITAHGEGFGTRRGGGSVWINRSDSSVFLGAEEPDLRLYIHVETVDHWSDSSIRFWIPQGVTSGSIYVTKSGRFSNPVPFNVNSQPGEISFGTPRLWSLRQEFIISRIGAFPGNSLYVRLPRPARGTGQGTAAVLSRPAAPNLIQLRESAGTDLFRFDELISGETRILSRQLAVLVRPVRTTVNPGLIRPYDSNHPELSAALTDDSGIRPSSVAGTSARVVGGLGDEWRKARAIYDYVAELLNWSDDPPSRVVSEYLSTRAADSEGYSFLFCSLARAAGIPARPVGGLLIDTERRGTAWWWAEIWIEGLGWIPVDPALGDGAPGFSADTDVSKENLREAYFGALDAAHIAFSRGILGGEPLQPSPVINTPDAFYSLQEVWEEASGNLSAYRSLWPLPRVTSVH